MVEKVALLTGYPGYGIFRSTCEVLDTSDPDTKIFRFKEGCNWETDGRHARRIGVYSHWSEFDVGPKEGSYRVCAVLETPPGYVAVLEGTTKPEVLEPSPPDISDESVRCELAIMAALESEPRMTMRELKRKVSGHRFAGVWDECLRRLCDEGEIKTEPDPTTPQRTWVVLAAQ